MNTFDVNELYKIWLKFLSTTKTEEGDIWLDTFLAKYLSFLCDSSGLSSNSFCFQWRSSGNILAHQLLSDMYQICEKVKSSPELQSSSDVSDPFKQYLLEGRGWKILWTLENIGIQNLFCLRDLIKLLILHVPVLMSLPYCSSTIPEALQRKPKYMSIESCFIFSQRNRAHNISWKWPSHLILKKKQNFLSKKRKRRKKFKPSDRNSSSGEDQILFEPVAIPASQLKALQKVNRINPLQNSVSSDSGEESELELNYPPHFSSYHISVVDFMHFMINLLQESTLLDQKSSEYVTCASPLILEFSLSTLKDLFNGRYHFYDWPKGSLHSLQSHLLKLVFLSAAVTNNSSSYTGALEENEVVSSLLSICETVSFFQEENSLHFVCETYKGCLLLIYNTVELCCYEFSKVINVIWTFVSNCQNFYKLVSYLAKLNTTESFEEISDLANLVKDIIVLMKIEKIAVVCGTEREGAWNLIHHHFDIFGSSASSCVITKEPVCSVAKMSSILLELLSLPLSQNIYCEVIRLLKICGICCCINPDYVTKTVFSKFSNYEYESQNFILILVEKHLYRQLGLLSKNKSECIFCTKRVNKNEFSLSAFVEKMHNSISQEDKIQLLNAELSAGSPFWSSFGIYRDLLNLSAPAEVVENISRHLVRIFSDGISDLRNQLFLRVILPEVWNSLKLSGQDFFRIRSKCMLSILQLALCDNSLAAIFVGFGGVRMLHQFILLPEFRRASLLVFKILISSECVNGMEIDDENKSATFSQYPTSNTFSLLLLERTSNFHQKFKTLLHSKYNKNLSSSTSSLFEDTTVLDSSNVVINEEEISILCDLWKCYQEIASDLSNEYFCFVISEKSFRSGYCMFFTLLENLNVVLTEQTVEEKPAIAKYLLLLTQNLLSVCVTNMREKSERISFLEEVKLDLIKHFPNYVKHLGLLFNFILKCCFSTPFFVSTSSHLKLQDAFDVIDDTTSSSGTETHSNESYCGDTEGSNGNLNNKKALYEMSYQCVIEHAEIVAILIELLIHFQSEHSNEWSESALHVMQVLKKMCQDCEFNRVVLCKQGISSLLLQSLGLSFKDLPCDSINYQTVTMELFVILSKCRISAADLEMLINFFKYPHAPLPLLLKSLNDMVEDMSPHPVWSVSFPSPKFSDSTDRVKKRLKKCFNIHLKSVSPSPWTEAAMCFPISEDTRWNNGFTKGFCCSLWLKIDSTKDLKMSTPKISDEDLCRSELHVISFGSDKFLLELWYNTWDNDLIIRINSYNNGEMICLSKGVCKSLFQMNMWHHLTLNYIESSPKSLINCRVQIVVDGTKGNIFNLSFNRIGNTTTDFYVLLGHTKDNLDDETLPSNYSIGSFMLFKGDVLTREVIFYLASLGPNSINISKCALLNQNMFVPKEAPSWSMSSLVDLDVILGLKTPSLEPLQNSLVCCYTAENKDSYLVYPVTPRGFFPLQVSFSSGGNSKLTSLQDGIYSKMPIELQVLVFGKISQKEYRTLQSAILQAGGSAIFLLLFAYILENSNSEEDQIASLKIILKLINKDSAFQDDFIRIKGYELLTQMIVCKKCIVSDDMFQLFLQNCLKFDSKLNITALASEEVISEQSSLAISNGAIFSVMLKSHPFAKNISPNTVASLFLLIERLLNPKSTKFRINSIQMNHINVLDILLWIIKRHCIMGEGFLPLKALQVIPSIMQKLLLYNFNGLIFENICQFMLLLHESSATYVCHSRSAFFFLRPVDKIGYEKKVDSSTWYIDSSSDFYPLQPSFPSYNRSLLSKRQLSVPNEQVVPFQKKLPKVKSADDLLLTEEEITSSDPETSSDQTSSLEEKFSKSIEEDIGKEFPILMSVLEVKNKEKSAICIGLLQLIHGFILKSNSTNIQHPSGIIQLEVFIVLANAVDSEVCAFALKIIQAYLFEANEDTKNAFLKMKGFHLLANQLNVRTFDKKVFDVCFSLISGVPLSSVIECNMFLSKEASDFQTMSWLPFLAVLPSSYLEPSLCEKAILLLIKFLKMDCSVIVELLNNGLMMSISSLISCICHSSEKKIADNLHAPMEALHCLLKAVSYELCSSKNGKHFYALSNSVNLFTALEKKCLEECGADSHCLMCWRKCLCHIYQIIFEFSETPSFHPPIEHSPISDKASSVWELLSELQESLGTFSAHHAAVSTDDIQQPKSTADIDVDKFWRDVPTSEVIKRLESLVEAITHFIVFKDPRIKISHYEREFVKSFFNFCMKGISSTIVRNINTAKQEYSNLMFCIKDSLKNQLGLLIFSFLSPSQDVFIKEYVVDVLSTHPLSSKILRLVIFTITKVEILFAFLVDLQVNPEMQIKRNGIMLYKIVKEILREDARVGDLFRQPQVIQKLKLEWVKLWNEDRLKWYAALNNSNEKLFQKFESLAQDVSSIAFNMTQKVFEIQNNERKHFIEELKRKYYEEASERRIWLRLIEQMTHEKAVWFQNDLYPNSWELDPTEGPSRVRRRFKRCFLNLDSRFLRVDTQTKLNRDLPFVNLLVNRNEFPDSAAVLHRLHSHEQIQYTSPCKIVTAFDEAKVEVLVGAYHIHLIGEETSSYGKISQISESWPFETIKEIVPRRYELQNNAFEIFLTNGLTYLIAFESEKEYHHIWKQLESHDLPCKSNVDVSILTQLWRERALTNFEYLTQLNKLSGRSFNDLMQYPVFPFVLSDYGSSYLDLCNPSVYRNLEKPVAVQHKYREKFYMDTYELLKEQASCSSSTEFELPISGPYHYGSHYSNSGTVLHFLIRILPFTYSFIKYQDNNFDIPDRTFHSIETSWQLVTKDSTSDVKELIPEFFFLPEFLCNKNDFDFGVRQSGIRVNDVLLPPWCKQNPRLFVLIHRQVLESENVTRSIHNWIDLVFGCKQTGEAAFSAINVFHPATYYGLDINQWKDPITKQAVQVMIKTLGQMPKQLFTSPHPMVSIPFSAFSVSNEIAEPMEVVDTVNGLHWGNYVGSPSTAAPSLVWCRKQKVVLCNLLPLLANYIFGLGENICLILNHRKNPGSNVSSATYIMSAALVSWGHKDNVIRIKLCRDQPAIPLLKENSLDPVCLCASVPDCRELFVAHLSGTIFVYTLSLDSNNLDRLQQTLPLQLKGHTDTITSICICKPFSVFVSGSKDKSVIVWDLNKLCYVRTLTKHEESIDLVCVSDTLGDVASISNEHDQGHLKVCTINGESIGCVNIPDVVTAMCYSTAPEGISVNVIATGMRCGNICLWSSWDLKPVREIICDKFHFPIKCLVFSSDNQHLFASNENGTVAVWEKPSKGLSNVPRLLIFT